MKIIEHGRSYRMWQLGSNKLQKLEFPNSDDLSFVSTVVKVLHDRSIYLNDILPCNETTNAIYTLSQVIRICGRNSHNPKIIDQGHVYKVWDGQRITFVKRSTGSKKHQEEWPGVQTQEVIRALIDYCKNHTILVEELRLVIFEYEVRAWRRKQEEVNRKQPEHNDTERPRPWREFPYNDIPFGPEGIELLPVGDDGHIILPTSKAA